MDPGGLNEEGCVVYEDLFTKAVSSPRQTADRGADRMEEKKGSAGDYKRRVKLSRGRFGTGLTLVRRTPTTRTLLVSLPWIKNLKGRRLRPVHKLIYLNYCL